MMGPHQPTAEAGAAKRTEGPRRAVVLLSGGLDSTTVLALARADGYEVWALTVDYGQRHAIELEAARRVARHHGAERHLELSVDLARFGGSALTADIPVPVWEPDGDRAGSAIPVTYVPARNTVLLSLALACAEVAGANDIFIGVNAVDYSGYPDCRPEFIDAFERLARLATRAGVEGAEIEIHAPLIGLTKAEIVRMGTELGVDYRLTTSCYDPQADGTGCGRCDACVLRRRGFEGAGLVDPVPTAG